MMKHALDLDSLRASYAGGADPGALVRAIYAEIARIGERPVWIALVPQEQALARAADLQRRRAGGEVLPLYGVPFAVKDNIDVAGLETTAACPAFAYSPTRSATVVERLEAAGAILIGKTNLDQFATGLVGVRSPYGIPSCVFDPAYVSGGSSSGSAVAVASGLVSFALGTDTAGSGRVPAAFNNIVGLKPTKGWLSIRGVVPACRSQDCVSVFAGTVEDALCVAEIAGGYDADEPFSRPMPEASFPTSGFRFGVSAAPLEFFGDAQAALLYEDAVARLEQLGGTKVAIDYTPFRETANLLYSGPWVAERLAAIEEFAQQRAHEIHPVVRDIVLGGAKLSAVDAFKGQYRLAELARAAEAQWTSMDVMLLPTTGTIYRIDEVLDDPVRLNSNLGAYTNFVNLLDLCAVAVPAGFRPNGLPFGVTLIGRAFEDRRVAAIAGQLHRTLVGAEVGATGFPLPIATAPARNSVRETAIEIAVVGAHLSGLPLNRQLTDRGARLVRSAHTASGYSLYALPNTAPERPGMVFDRTGRGHIEIEIWEMPSSKFGSFIAEIPPPLSIGTVMLDDGTKTKGFLCESFALADARDITAFGGWRAYLDGTR